MELRHSDRSKMSPTLSQSVRRKTGSHTFELRCRTVYEAVSLEEVSLCLLFLVTSYFLNTRSATVPTMVATLH